MGRGAKAPAWALGLMGMLIFGVGAAHAATVRYVSPTGHDAGNECVEQASPCATIQHAVDVASAGDTVQVGAGAFSEQVTVSKSLTLLGAQNGVDARSGGVPESEETTISIASGSDFTLTGGSVTIDGFKVTNSGGNDGVFITGGSNDVVQNDFFSGIANGFAVSGILDGATIRHNLVEGARYGIQSDLAPGPNTTIDSNRFVGTSEYDVNFVEGGSGDVVSDNEREGGAGNFIVLFKTNGASVVGNRATGVGSSVVYVGGGTGNTTISGNSFSGNLSNGVAIAEEFGYTAQPRHYHRQ